MLPVVSGVKVTKINIFVYSILLLIFSLTPYFFSYAGINYFVFSFFLGIYYVYLCYKLLTESLEDKKISKKIFVYSILYLFLIFAAILIDSII